MRLTFDSLIIEGDKKEVLTSDLIAAFTVAVMIIPQAMAYAVLAGFPPIYGLYTCLLPLAIYPLIGKSKFLSVGPVAILSVILLSGLAEFAEPQTAEYIKIGIFVGLVAGMMQVLFAIFRLGFLVNFLSQPVLTGFISAAALIIISSQLKHFFGLEVERSQTAMGMFTNVCKDINNCDLWSMIICGTAIVGMLFLKKVKKSFPSALFILVLASVLVHFLKLDSVKLIGSVPSGLPSFYDPLQLDKALMISLLPLCFVIALISFIESYAIAKALGSRHGVHRYDSNKETLALGVSKIFGAFFQSMPSTGSFSRSAVNESSGAKSGWSSIFAAILVVIALLFLTKLFYYIPYPILAAIIIASVIKLVDIKEMRYLYATDRSDFWLMLITFFSTLLMGIQLGIFTGLILSFILILRKVSKPETAILGEIDSGIYKNIDRFGDAYTNDHVLIFRYDDDIFFGNADHFYDSVTNALKAKPSATHLILDMSSVSNIDSTGVKNFKILIHMLRKAHIKLHLSGPKGILRDRLDLEGIRASEWIRFHLRIEKAMEEIGG